MTFPPETVVSMRPRILADEVARNSILGFWTLCGISALSTLALTPRTWSAIRQAIRSRASESSFVPGHAMNARGRSRVLCLYLASVLLLLESLNSLIYYRNLWVWRDGNAIAMNVIRTFTLYPAGPLLIAATGYRISLLLAIQPQLRTRLFWALVGITTTVAAIGMITNVVAIALNAEVAKDLVAWQSVVMFPSWMAPLLAVIPLSIVGMTLWSLKLSFGVMSEQANVQIMTVSTSFAAADLGSSQTSGASGGSSPGASGQRHSDYVHPSSLGTTFKVLTLLLALYWSIYLAVIALYRPFPMHSTAITAPITAVAVATEASFEWLVHAVVAHRQRRQHRREPKHHACNVNAALSAEIMRTSTKSQLLAVSSALMVSKSGHIDELDNCNET